MFCFFFVAQKRYSLFTAEQTSAQDKHEIEKSMVYAATKDHPHLASVTPGNERRCDDAEKSLSPPPNTDSPAPGKRPTTPCAAEARVKHAARVVSDVPPEAGGQGRKLREPAQKGNVPLPRRPRRVQAQPGDPPFAAPPPSTHRLRRAGQPNPCCKGLHLSVSGAISGRGES